MCACTCVAEGSGVRRQAAVAQEAVGPLGAAAPVAAQRPVAAAVTRAAGPNPRRDPRPLLQVQRDAVQLQGADAAPEALLPGRRASCKRRRQGEETQPRQAVEAKRPPHRSALQPRTGCAFAPRCNTTASHSCKELEVLLGSEALFALRVRS